MPARRSFPPPKSVKKKLKDRKQRLEKLTSGQVAGQATKEVVEAMQAAILVSAVIVPVVVTST